MRKERECERVRERSEEKRGTEGGTSDSLCRNGSINILKNDKKRFLRANRQKGRETGKLKPPSTMMEEMKSDGSSSDAPFDCRGKDSSGCERTAMGKIGEDGRDEVSENENEQRLTGFLDFELTPLPLHLLPLCIPAHEAPIIWSAISHRFCSTCRPLSYLQFTSRDEFFRPHPPRSS